MIYKTYIFLLLLGNFAVAQKIIIVFGPSCSGKSTLSKKIAQQLGDKWHLLDRDDLIESGSLDEDDLVGFADFINKMAQTSCVVIDTNSYTQDFFKALKPETKLRVAVYAPIATLLARDELRTQRLARTPQRALRAKQFVIDNYNYFFCTKKGFDTGFSENNCQINTPFEYDLLMNSDSFESEKVLEIIKKRCN
jgi:AAA domain